MNIKCFIQDQILLPRLKKSGVLAVYDPDHLYHELCLDMATEKIRVIDTSESSIESREESLKTLRSLGNSKELEGMLVYVPAKAPLSDEEKQVDPFSIYSACGSVFPDGAGDEYMHLCLKAKPDHSTEIRRIFKENPLPTFAVIDALGGGSGWPNLQVILGVESARDILFALLVPSDRQKDSLKENETWVSEAKELFDTCIGLKLITRGKTWSSIGDELWRFLLYSEFVFDLPESLPDSLSNVPRAPEEAKHLVEDLCDRLRNDRRTQSVYIDRAETIERDLDLPGHCKAIKDLGVRDTFPFEERSFLAQTIDALKLDETDRVRSILGRHKHSVWIGKGESQAQWGLIRSALALCEACDDYSRQLPDHSSSFDNMIDFYIGRFREVDRLQREFEQSIADLIDADTIMDSVVEKARENYRRVAAKVHDLFIRHLETNGWPPLGRLANADVFDTWIAPKLQESGRKVAYLLIDALRYELGVALEKQLSEDDSVELSPAFAQLPTITTVGMASLLPEAGKTLTLAKDENKILPMLGTSKLAGVNQRMDVLRNKYGQRFTEMTLANFIRSKKKLPETVELLVLRSAEIDSQLETAPEAALRLIHDTLKRIRVAIYKLKGMGFQDVVIATDHGFFLNTHVEAGDVCAKPAGNWMIVHDRFALGDGTADAANFVLSAEHLGIRGDFGQASGPRGLVPYRAGELYFHGGASLQECVVPVISIKLGEMQLEPQKPKFNLSYKNEAKRITTRLPVIDVELVIKQIELFPQQVDFELLLEAHDKKGNVVGEAKAGGPVNPATGTISMKPGERIQVTLKMLLEFEGKFTVKAMNPNNFAIFCKLDLETDYVV
ncbi:MAG: PglZ domain-containing protein [Desulfobacterales bacterium]|nr:PglZ domain-containing protein [Desulfobacterales bacterium]